MKRIAIAITIACLFTVVCFAPMLSADPVDDNPEGTTLDELSANDSMVNNYGTIREFYGTLTNNIGTIHWLNNGSVTTSTGTIDYMYGGTVASSSGRIKTIYGGDVEVNSGTIEYQSYGTIGENTAYGIITTVDATQYQHGTVTTNNGKIASNYGTIVTNNGTVDDNYGTITNNTGTIKNNWGTVTNNTGTIQKQYYPITFVNDNSATVMYAILNYDTAYVSVDSKAVLVSSAGYKFSSEPIATGCTLVKVDDSTYNITDVTGPVTITATTESTSDCLFWVGNTPVTGTSSGTGWSYNATTNTLTLNAADIYDFHYGPMKDINNEDIYSRSIIYDGRDTGLNIVLQGHSVLAEMFLGLNFSIYVKGDLNISGTGSLHAATGCKSSAGIWSAGKLTVAGGKLVVSGCTVGIGSVGDMTFSGGSVDTMVERGSQCIFSPSGAMTVSGATVTAYASHGFDVWIGWNNFSMSSGTLNLSGSGCLDVNGTVTITGGTINSTAKSGYVIGVTGNGSPGSDVFTMTGGNVIVSKAEKNQMIIYAGSFVVGKDVEITNITPMKYDKDLQEMVECTLEEASELHATADGAVSLTSGPATPRVTFNANGGTCATPYLDIIDGHIASIPEATRIGHTFNGWYTQQTGGTKISTSTVFQDSTTVYAHWTPNKYTITFDTKGGTAIPPITKDYGTAITKPADPTKAGYTFAGWDRAIPDTMPAENIKITASWTPVKYYLTINYTGYSEPIDQYKVQYDYGSQYSVESPVKTGYTADLLKVEGTMDSTEGKTYTVTYTVNMHTLTINYLKGTEQMAPTYIKQYGYDSKYSVDSPSINGYKCDKTKVEDTMADEDVTVNVEYTPVEYTITYVLNGGTQDAGNPTKYTIETETFSLLPPTRENSIFLGWFSDGYEVKTVQKGSYGNITVSAKWGFDVKYVNGEESKTLGPYEEGSDFVIDSFIGSYIEGKIFAGWKIENSEKIYKVGSVYENITSCLEFVPVWEDQVRMTFKDGDVIVDIISGFKGTPVTGPVIQKDGKNFLGWKVDGEGEIIAITVIPESDTTYVAAWADKITTVTINVIGDGIVKINGVQYDPDHKSVAGSTAVIEAIPSTDVSVFKKWSDNGAQTHAIALSGNTMELTATFETVQETVCVITKDVGEHGTIQGPTQVKEGDEAVFVIVPEDNYIIESISVDGTPIDSLSAVQKFTVTAAFTIGASFVQVADGKSSSTTMNTDGSVTESIITEEAGKVTSVDITTKTDGKVEIQTEVVDTVNNVTTVKNESEDSKTITSEMPVEQTISGNGDSRMDVDADAISSAIKQAKELDDSDSEQEITISATGTVTTAEKTVASLESASMAALSAEDSKVDKLILDTGTGKVELDQKSLAAIAGEGAKGDEVQISIGLMNVTEMTEAQKSIIGDSVTISITAKAYQAGEVKADVHNLNGGKTKITVSYDAEGPDPSSLKVMYVSATGDVEFITDVQYDDIAKTLTFEVSHFSPYVITYDHAITVTVGEHGTVSPGTINVADGQDKTFTVSSAEGYTVDSVKVDGAAAELTDGKYTFSNVTTDHTLAVTFKSIVHGITMVAVNGSATATPSSAAAGTQITIFATPDSGYEFGYWEVVSGDITISSNKFIMPDTDVTIRAVFNEEGPGPGPEPIVPVEDATAVDGKISPSDEKAIIDSINAMVKKDKDYKPGITIHSETSDHLTLSKALVKAVVDNKGSFDLILSNVAVSLDSENLKGIKGDLELTADEVEAPEKYRPLVGDRIVYDLTLTSDSETFVFVGYVNTVLPYALASGEDPDNLYVAYLGVEIEDYDCYYFDGYVEVELPHFSPYVVLYKMPDPVEEAVAVDGKISEGDEKAIIDSINAWVKADKSYVPHITIHSETFDDLTISEDLVKAVADNKGSFILLFDNAIITLFSQNLKGVAGDITIGAEETDVPDKYKTVVGDRTVYDLSIVYGAEKFVFSGKVKVVLPYALATGEVPENLYVAYLGDSIEEFSCTYSDGFVEVDLPHFSPYVVLYKSPEPEPEKDSGDNTMLYVGVAVAVLAVIAIAAFLFIRRK